jgi:hypothetical protein
MSLPTSRNTTYAPAAQVKSADLNALQDMIIGMKWPSHWRWRGAIRGGIETNIVYDNGAGSSWGIAKASAGTAKLYGLALDALPVGTRITAMGLVIAGTASGQTVAATLAVVTPGSGPSTIDSHSVVNPTNAVLTVYTHTLASPYTLVQGDQLSISIDIPNSGTLISAVGVQIDRL